MPELAKAYEPQQVEDRLYAQWQESGVFRADPKSPKPPYSIVMPPPNVTGKLTLGHVLNNTIQDILARKARMEGREVLWLPGTDHAGLATQTAVEKHLRNSEKKTRHDFGREAFVQRVWDWKHEFGGIITQQLRKIGASCDWSRERFTLDDDYARAVQKVFVRLYDEGLIYRGTRMVNWCPGSLTALSDEEVIPTKQKGSLYYVKYQLLENSGGPDNSLSGSPQATGSDLPSAPSAFNLPPSTFLVVATTRPETIMADVALAVKPNGKWSHLIGRYVQRPLHHAPIPIIADEAVEEGFGTGVLKVTPAHDKTDYEIGKRHKLEFRDILTPNGKINDPGDHDAAELHGLDRFEARKRSAEMLKERGLLEKEEPYENNVGFSERANVPIEPRLSEQWFLKYPNIPEALALLRDGHVKFHPAHWTKVYEHWLENIQDWCISRQVWWGHRIPVWYRNSPPVAAVYDRRTSTSASPLRHPEPVEGSVQPSASGGPDNLLSGSPKATGSDSTPVEFMTVKEIADRLGSKPYLIIHTLMELNVFASSATTINREITEQLCKKIEVEFVIGEAPNGDGSKKTLHWPKAAAAFAQASTQPETRCQIESPGEGWIQDPDTLDTWFSSWLWAYETMRTDDGTRQKFYPTSALVTGPDIIFLWVARMLIAGLHFQPNGAKPTPAETLDANLAFKDVYFTGLIRDKQGRKLSKSLGNSPDPLDLIAKYGADGLRFGLIRIAPQGADIRFDEKQIEEGRNFCNKLWNICRFRAMQGPVDANADPFKHDRSIFADELLDRLHFLLEGDRNALTALNQFNFSEAASQLYDFVWNDFAARYVEAAKSDFAQTASPTRAGTLATFDYVMSRVLRLLHPFAPFVTEELWRELGFGTDTIQLAAWPAESPRPKTWTNRAQEIYLTADAGRQLRGEVKLPSSQKIPFSLVPNGKTLTSDEISVLAAFLNASEIQILNAPPANPGPKAFSALGDLYLPATGLVDPTLERDRLTKELAKVEKDLEQTRRKLGDANMLAKAPPAKVEEWRALEISLAEKEKSLRESLSKLG